MRIPDRVVQEIVERARIEDVVGDYVQLTRKGDRLWGLSPFKPEKTPSFSVSPDKNAYFCFSTQQGGGAVQFIMQMEHLSYPEALSFLAKKLGIDVSSDDGSLSESYKTKNALIELYQRLTQTFHYLLLQSEQGSKARAYLSERGLDDKVVSDFSLGWSPDDPRWLYRFLLSKQYTSKFLAESGLFSKKHAEWSIFSGRIMFPIGNVSGESVAFGGRILTGDGPKYINSPETAIFHKGSNLFALDKAKESIKKTDEVIVCEGYMDVIALHASGLTNAVAPLGTAFTPEQAKLLKRYASKIVLFFDGDEAGIRATLKTLSIAEGAEFSQSFIIELPEGVKDPSDIFQERGSHAVQKMLDYKVDAFLYLERRLALTASIQTISGREQLVESFRPYIESIKNELKKQDVTLRVLSLLKMESDDGLRLLKGELQRRSTKESKRPEEKTPEVSKPLATSKNEQLNQRLDMSLMLALFLNGELFTFVRGTLQIEDLDNEWARQLFVILEESFRSQQDDIEARIETIDISELKALVQKERISGAYETATADAVVREGMQRIKLRNLLSRGKHVDLELRRLGAAGSNDPSVERELLEEKIIIDTAIKELRTHIDDRSAE